MESRIHNLKKDFGIIEDLSDIQFIQIQKENYKTEVNTNTFGEKLGTFYMVHFSIFNLVYSMKILVFIYEKYCEVLKLDLKVQDDDLEKEIASCVNFLQRHRNLNSTFLNLKRFSRFCESRRLIVNIVLKKEPRISLRRNEEGGLCIKYICDSPKILIEITWKIDWDLKNCDILDVIEVYYNNFELPNSDFIKDELEALTHHSMDFSLKLKLWKQLLSDLAENTRPIEALIVITDNDTNDNVLVISDSDDDGNQSEELFHRSKRRKVGNNVTSQVIHVAD